MSDWKRGTKIGVMRDELEEEECECLARVLGRQ